MEKSTARMAREVKRIALLIGTMGLTLSPTAGAGERLIQLSEFESRWMDEGQISMLSQIQHDLGRCGGFMDITRNPEFQRPTPLRVLPAIVGRKPAFRENVRASMTLLSSTNLANSVRALSTQFPNRHHKSNSGVDAAKWLQGRFIALSKGRSDVNVQLFTHSFKQPSVIATIAGDGPYANERVILGAHLDSINWKNGMGSSSAPAPGADDDASGVATLLETFRVLIDSGFRPARTIEFMAFAGEEGGLLGSQDIASKYKRDKITVAGMFQMDMTGYPDPKTHGISMITDFVSKDLTDFVTSLIEEYVEIPWYADECGYGCSDHASWHRAGFPSAFPFEAPFDNHNPKIHSTEDKLELLDFEFSLNFAKLATAFAVELGLER